MLFFLKPIISNLLHIPAYGLLFILWYRYLSNKTSRVLFYSFVITLAIGILNELYQFLIPNRYPSIMDMMLNIVGAGLGFVIVRNLYYKAIK